LGVAVAMLAWSLVRRDNPQPAISGFIGVAICVFIAWRTGSAKGYFLYGIITQAVYGGVFLISAVIRWPLVGVIWGFLDGRGLSWRTNQKARRWYAVATWVWAGLFAIRAVLQYVLYLNDEVNWLGAARIGMGWPLALAAFVVTAWSVHRAMSHEAPAEGEEAEDPPVDDRSVHDPDSPAAATTGDGGEEHADSSEPGGAIDERQQRPPERGRGRVGSERLVWVRCDAGRVSREQGPRRPESPGPLRHRAAASSTLV